MATSGLSFLSEENRVTFFKLKVYLLYERVDKFESDTALTKLRDLNEEENNLDTSEIGCTLRESFDESIMTINDVLRSQLRKVNICGQPCSTFRPEELAPIVRSRRPELKLPTFRGEYTEWADFFSLFLTIIDKDPSMADIEKMQHLRSCLKDTAVDTIRSLEICDANYKIALELLHNRFNNRRLVFQAHIMEILGLKRVEAGSAAKLRSFVNRISAHMRALQIIGNAEQIAEIIIVQSLLQKLDSTTQIKLEESLKPREIPSWEDFVEFLENRCRTLENVDYAMASYSPCNQFCHLIYRCTQFPNLSTALRYKEAMKLGLCINCLKKGYQYGACNSGSCKSYGIKHHTLLHNPSSAVINSSLPASLPSSSTAFIAQNPSPNMVLLAAAIVIPLQRV